MHRLLRVPARVLAAPAGAVRRRPRLAVAAGLVLLTGLGLAAGGYAYVRHHRRAAAAALAADRPADARPHLDRVLAVWPWDVEAHRLAARAARVSGDLPAAEEYLTRAIRLNGGATEALQLEFLLLRAQTGDLDQVSNQLFAAAEAGHPEAPLILETVAKSYLARLRYKLAFAALSRWLELYPGTAKAHVLRGYAYERLGNHHAARQEYHRALEADPDNVVARLRVAEMLMEDKQAPEALPHLERLIRREPDNPTVQARLGICRALQGRPDEARRLMEAALVRLPTDPTLLIALAQLDIQEGRGAEAEARLRRVLAADPGDTEARYNLSPALRLQGRTEEAEAVLAEYARFRELVDRSTKLLQEVPDNPTATAADYAELGETLLAIGRERPGLSWLERALEKDPTHQPTLKALAAYYQGKGDAARAAAYRARLR
jgi:tetratricopeptide (TPR) repeat protein